MFERKSRQKLVLMGGQFALTLALVSAYSVAEAYGSYEAMDGEVLRAVQAGTFAEHMVQDPAISSAEVGIAADVPYAGAVVNSVTPVGDGRYNVSGVALDQYGNLACALALASGRCMFTCGPGSLRCEGGTADLPFGQFELTNLPTESDGSILLQVFVQEHVSFAGVIDTGLPTNTARWGAFNGLCCPTSSITFSVTIDGVTKRSVAPSCGSESTWEGWASTSPGAKAVTGTTTAASCPDLSFSFTSQELVSSHCYIFSSDLDSGGNPSVFQADVDCAILP